MLNRLNWTAVVLICLLATGTYAASGNLVKKQYEKHRTHFGMKLGINNLGTARVDDVHYNTNVGLSGGFYFDFVVSKNLFWSLTFDFQDLQFFQEREAMLNINIGIKPAFYHKNGKIGYKPGFMVGLADLGHIGPLKRTQYVTMKCFFELIFFTEQKYVFSWELAVWGTSHCFDSEHDISLGPFFQLRAGLMFLN